MSKFVIFDCDGTLVDSEIIATKVFIKFWASHGVEWSEQGFKETFIGKGRNAPEVLDNFSKMPAHVAQEGDELLAQAIAKDLTAVDGMTELLDSLKLDRCVASNSSLNHVKNALSKTKLQNYFQEKVFSAEQVTNPKPAADLFEYAASICGYNFDDCIVVEDSVSGVRAAQNANMKVVGFTGAGHFIPSLEQRLQATNPDWFCSSIKELEQLLSSFS